MVSTWRKGAVRQGIKRIHKRLLNVRKALSLRGVRAARSALVLFSRLCRAGRSGEAEPPTVVALGDALTPVQMA